ncbi:hypothetical protein AMS68_000716 [Peltaster fructicola]|uniref:Protein HRI1 n=1 Tax=Peltaster fructicola TaxID=286661 RepID=A0A6H0XKP0_9PEZI|nr:hypothetical protein AMS68_000716 [Peltaster fructicola]
MSASISRRAFIQWMPDKAAEPTSTVVLTSPQNRFVDIRLLRTGPNSQGHGNERPSSQLDGAIQLKHVDWAFAGTSASTWHEVNKTQQMSHDEIEQYRPFACTAIAEQSQETIAGKVQHTIWTHTIDSRFLDADRVQDEGDMIPMPSLGLTLERGNMCNPATGQATDYVEGWIDDAVESTDYAVLELSGEARGLFIKLGSWMQGVARAGDNFALQRWHQTDGAWSLQATLGNIDFPSNAASSSRLRVGDNVTAGNGNEHWTWTVIESGNA